MGTACDSVSCYECHGTDIQTWTRYFGQRVAFMCNRCAGTGRIPVNWPPAPSPSGAVEE